MSNKDSVIKKYEKNVIKRENDLFDNPHIDQLKKIIPMEYQEKQSKAGEGLFKFNFEKGMVETPEIIDEITEQIKFMLQSGMHPSYLNYDEKDFLKTKYGDEWYKKFGIDPMDLNRINM